MKELFFKCVLKSDVVLNAKSGTSGSSVTLDFIPGSCFLGIVAKELYPKVDPQVAMTLFHSGKVRFGDAQPSVDGKRAQKVPAAIYYPKGDKLTQSAYVLADVENHDAVTDSNGNRAQLKQAREGFYIFDGVEARHVKTAKSFAIKSAYDSEKRKSKDTSMFGYESLTQGLEMMFSVEIEDESLKEDICRALVGLRRVGRSKTAQYGLVEISRIDEPQKVDHAACCGEVNVYADSRLVFFDGNGQFTFRPTPEQLGLPSGEIDWSKSQIRTFQYAPWNTTRQAFDSDRCGIEKGSVFVVKYSDELPCDKYVGSYKNEGFGKVIYNPAFLESQPGKNGLVSVKFAEEKPHQEKTGQLAKVLDSALVSYLAEQKKRSEATSEVYEGVNKFVANNAGIYTSKITPSQWGTIRSIALASNSDAELEAAIEDYITHGVKADDWTLSRQEQLRAFMRANRSNLWEAIINLASQMAKK